MWQQLLSRWRYTTDPQQKLRQAYATKLRVVCSCRTRVFHGTIDQAPTRVDCKRCGQPWEWLGSRAHWLDAIDGDRVIRLPAPPPVPLPPDHPIARLKAARQAESRP